MKNKLVVLAISLLLSILMLSSVNAYDTKINVSFNENIIQNVSYEKTLNSGESQDGWATNGEINISNMGTVTVYDIYVKVVNTRRLLSNFTNVSGRPSSQISGGPNQSTIIHVPELRATEHTLLNYTLDSTDIKSPLAFHNNYFNDFAPKVLEGRNFSINATITNNISSSGFAYEIYDVNITMTTNSLPWANASLTKNFTFASLYARNDSNNVSQESNRIWHWTPGNGTMASGKLYQILFNITAPTAETTGTHLALNSSLVYTMAGVISNLSVSYINASARVDINNTKQLMGYYNSTSNVAEWRSTPTVYTPINVSFLLKRVTLWVTTDLDPNNQSTAFNKMEVNYTPSSVFNSTTSWTGANYNFNFTDGANATDPPPVIWMKPFYIIDNRGDQLVNFSFTEQGSDIYYSYVYIIQGYWLEIKKNITNTKQNQFKVNIWVHNKGSSPTPTNMTVTAYDLVPTNFTPFNFTPESTSNSTLTSGEFRGQAFKWDLGLNYSGYQASLAADDGAPGGTDEWTAEYFINGTGDYKVSQLYIIGLDPRKVDGAGASPLITILKSIQNRSNENIYLTISIFLLIITIFNTSILQRKQY